MNDECLSPTSRCNGSSNLEDTKSNEKAENRSPLQGRDHSPARRADAVAGRIEGVEREKFQQAESKHRQERDLVPFFYLDPRRRELDTRRDAERPCAQKNGRRRLRSFASALCADRGEEQARGGGKDSAH